MISDRTNSTRCLLCGSGATRKIADLPTRVLVKGYRTSGLEVDVAKLLASAGSRIELRHCTECDLRWYSPAIAGDADFYIALQRHDWYYQAEKAEYHFARHHVPAGARVLEVGCGHGALRCFLPTDLHYRGLEFNREAVLAAQRAGLDVALRSIEDEAHAKPEYYDVICHFQVLEHVVDPRSFMRACVQALRPGGLLIVAVPAEDSFVGLAKAAWLNMPPHHLSRWTDAALRNLFDSIGVVPELFWHEPVASYHLDWQRSVVIHCALRSIFGFVPVALRSPRWLTSLARRAGTISWVATWLQLRGLREFPKVSNGHTVCLVGRKIERAETGNSEASLPHFVGYTRVGSPTTEASSKGTGELTRPSLR